MVVWSTKKGQVSSLFLSINGSLSSLVNKLLRMHEYGKEINSLGTSHARIRYLNLYAYMLVKKNSFIWEENVAATCPKTRRKKGFHVGALNAHLMSSSPPSFFLPQNANHSSLFLFLFLFLFFFSPCPNPFPYFPLSFFFSIKVSFPLHRHIIPR